MASRYDTIPQFNPFVQPAPLELVSQVGMKKELDYQEGVRQVQAYVDKVAGIDLLKEADKKYLQTQLGKLGDNIRSVARQDFSNPNLQGAVSSMALGIFNDKNVQNGYLGTQKVRTKQAQIAELRKSKPELYNPTNEAYSMLDVTAWLNDGTAGTPLVDRHDYYNYHDYSKEIREAMKDFKPSKIKRTMPLQGHEEWMVTNSDESWTDAEVREYLNGVLSPQARQQLKIEGTVAFVGKDAGLLSAYYEDLKDNVKTNKDLIAQYQAQSSVVDSNKKKILQSKIDALNDQNIDLSKHLDKIDSRDLDFFNSNKEGIAGKLYSNEILKASTRAYTHVDIEEKYEPNEIWKTKFTQSMENARANARMGFDAQQNALNRQERALDRQQAADLKMLELGYKYYDKDGKLKDIGKGVDTRLEKALTNVGEASLQENGRDLYEKERASVKADITDAYKKLRSSLLENNPDLKSQFNQYIARGGREMTASDPSSIATLAYLKDQTAKPVNKRDKWASEFIETVNSRNTRQAVLDQQKSQIDDEVIRNYGRPIAEAINNVNKFTPIEVPIFKITTNDNIGSQNYGAIVSRKQTGTATITGKDILDYMTGAGTANKKAIIFNALNQPANERANRANPIKDFYDQVFTKVGGRGAVKTLTDAIKFENNLYNQSSVNLGDWWTPVGAKDPSVQRAITYISNQVGADKDEIKVARVNRTTGEIQFKVSPSKTATGKSTSNVDIAYLESLGYKYDAPNDTYTLNKLDYFKRDYTGFTPTEQELIRALDVNVNLDRNTYSTPAHLYDPNGNGHFIRIVKTKARDGSYKYWLRDENNNVLIDQMDFEDPISAIQAAKTYTADPERAQIIANSKK
jgi:hypothetical protein